MRIARHRPLALIAGGAMLLAVLSGCGGDKTQSAAGTTTPTRSASPSPSEPASPSASASESATPDALSTEGAAGRGERLTKDNLVPTMLAAMRAKKTAHMSMEIGSSIGAEADVRYSGASTDMKMSMAMGPTEVAVIIVDGQVYLQQGAGAKYTKIDANDGAMGSMLGQMSSLGPESSVSAMRGAIRKVEYVGPDTVDGTPVTRYRVTLDSAALAGALSNGSGNLPSSVSYDLYVDADHLMRRFDMSVAGQHMTMRVSRWGEPVDIAAPPPSQVAGG